MKPRLLDLFCGGGGATRGYQMAGFHVTGVDIAPQPNYVGDSFYQADAMTYPLEGFDVLHASPPCHDHSMAKNSAGLDGTGWMLAATLERFRLFDGPWVIENVVGALLPTAIELCGASFGLGVSGMDLPRHRRFESNVPMMSPPCQHRPGKTLGVYGHGTNAWHRKKLGRNILEAEKREAMGISWMTRAELAQAIPPAYTFWVGTQLLEHLRAVA